MSDEKKRGTRHVLDARTHELDGALEDPEYKVDLPRALFGVLSARTHVEGGSAARVVPKDELFSGDGFGLDVLWRDERVEPELAPPFEGAFEALDGLGHVVFRGAYVAQDALVGLGPTRRVRWVRREKENGTNEPHALLLRQRALFRVGAGEDIVRVGKVGEDAVVLCLVVLAELAGRCDVGMGGDGEWRLDRGRH